MIVGKSPHYKGEETPELVNYNAEKDTFTIKPRALSIIWGSDPRYWKLSSQEGGPAEIVQVNWLEVTGEINMNRFVNKNKHYVVKFRVELKSGNFGWQNCPIYLMVRPGTGHRSSWKKANLSTKEPGEVFDVPTDHLLTFAARKNCYADQKLQFGLYEIWQGRWKGGLVIHEVVIEPIEHKLVLCTDQ